MSDILYDVVVIGAGHAGCEAALASARMGCHTLLLTTNLDNVALMPCNPSIGGPAKGHLVREIDALGGEMGRNIDRTFIQIRMLNTGKGPAVQALRAQADKKLYSISMKQTLERQANLDIKQVMVESILVEPELDCTGAESGRRFQARTATGWVYEGKTVVVTTGTFLNGRIIIGDTTYPAGRAGEFPAIGLSKSLLELGFKLGRLKTGTPPRIDARTIDFSKTEPQPGSPIPLHFSFSNIGQGDAFEQDLEFLRSPANFIYPSLQTIDWRPQLPCYLVNTNGATHDIIRSNLHRAPLYTGLIEGIGPRYCPSIEDKIVRFADKASHGLFLEPEGWQTNEVYVQGANTSLPEDVQLSMLRSIPALENVQMMRVGYAIEYDYVPSNQTQVSLESKLVRGLYFAGQINGTSGYEEAAAQGLVAGINAALRSRMSPNQERSIPYVVPDSTSVCPVDQEEDPFAAEYEGTEAVVGALEKGQSLILPRSIAYIGVMVDDLTSKAISEPYRLLTSRAEYRLLLRQDNADLRLTAIGYRLGLVNRERFESVERKRDLVSWSLKRLKRTFFGPTAEKNRVLAEFKLPPLDKPVNALDFVRRQEVTYRVVEKIIGDDAVPGDIAEQIEIEAKYEGYIRNQRTQVERIRKLEERRLPEAIDYNAIIGLRTEARLKLKEFGPLTLGQASRISGVTPADVAVLLVYLQKRYVGQIAD